MGKIVAPHRLKPHVGDKVVIKDRSGRSGVVVMPEKQSLYYGHTRTVQLDDGTKLVLHRDALRPKK